MTRFLKGLVLVGVFVVAGCSGGSSDSIDTPSSSCSSLSGTYAITGTVRYEDVEYAASGQTKSYFKPVRNAVIDLVACNGALLATTTTDETGAYKFTDVTTRPSSVSVLAKTTLPGGTEISLKGAGGGQWATTTALADKDLTQPVNIDIVKNATAISGVFNMLDVFAGGLEYVYSYYTPAVPLPALDIFWPNSYGTYTCSSYGANWCTSGAGIYITGTLINNNFYSYDQDQDHYDDDVLWHELAHYVEYSLGITESPGGSHSFSDNTLDLRLAWSEGHANYFQMAVKRWLLLSHPERLSIPATPPVNFPVTYYVDTTVDGKLLFPSIDLANPDASLAYGATSYYATNEVAVAKVVWEVSSLNSGGGEYAVWSAWTGDWWSPLPQYRHHSMELFWDGLLMSTVRLSTEQIYPLFSERRVNYVTDSYESQNDNQLNGRAVVDCTMSVTCVDEVHTLYLPNLVPDVDIVPISVTAGLTYTILTANLTNGADTKLRLLDSSGQVVTILMPDGVTKVELSNDDYVMNICANGEYCNNGSNFSSQLTYVPAASGVIYVEASNADFALQNAGAYGGYTLAVTVK